MPHDLAALHAVWNVLSDSPLPPIEPNQLEKWATWAQQNANQLESHDDLVTQLVRFASQKR